MGNFLCPKSRIAKLDAQDQAIFDCKVTRDKIKAYIKRLEKNEQIKKAKAKDALREKNRDKAKMFLTQAKMYTEQIKSSNGQLSMIEDQIIRIETAQSQKEAFKVLENGNKVLKQLNEEVNIEKWEKIADDMQEFREQQEEMNNFFKNHNIDQEQEVETDLEKLMQQESTEMEMGLPEAKKNIELPMEKVETKKKEETEKKKENAIEA